MFDKMDVTDLFPTPLWVVDLKPETSENLNSALLSEIHRLISPRPSIPLGSTWQTDPILHMRPEFAELISIIRSAVRGVLEFLEIDFGSFDITGCWANINPTGAINSSHTHPNNFLSGVYYVSVTGESGKIEFADPRPQAAVILPPVKRWNKYNGNKVLFDVKEGRLILFPAWLLHSVPVNRGQFERVSISFNIMFSSFPASMSKPLWKGTAPVRKS